MNAWATVRVRCCSSPRFFPPTPLPATPPTPLPAPWLLMMSSMQMPMRTESLRLISSSWRQFHRHVMSVWRDVARKKKSSSTTPKRNSTRLEDVWNGWEGRKHIGPMLFCTRAIGYVRV